MVCKTKNKKALEFFNIGNSYLESNKLSDARLFLYAAVKLDSNFCDAWDNLSVCCRRMGQYKDAFNSGIHSVLIDSTNPTAWLNCGTAAFLSNNINLALYLFDHMQHIIPNDPEGYYGKSLVLYSIDSISEARINISQAEQCYKSNNTPIGPDVYLLYGFIEYKNGNKKEAQKYFKKIYSKFRNNPELNYFYGMCLMENENDIKKYKKYLDKAKALGYTEENENVQK
ncbi:MAG: tetratricopeptide repeat protein [Alphaproteobacteria bacterium]|nr:tetratricopeptide repeat protein [Alphaproteobacteria bacterium]